MLKGIKNRGQENLYKRLSALEDEADVIFKSASAHRLFISSGLEKIFQQFIDDLDTYKKDYPATAKSSEAVTQDMDALEITLNYLKTVMTHSLLEKDFNKIREAFFKMTRILKGEVLQDAPSPENQRSMRGEFIVRQIIAAEKKQSGMGEAEKLAMDLRLKGLEDVQQENTELKTQLSERASSGEELERENTRLGYVVVVNQQLASQLAQKNTQLEKEFNDLAATKTAADNMNARLLEQNNDLRFENQQLQENLTEEQHRYLQLKNETGGAVEARDKAERLAADAIKSHDEVSIKLAHTVKARQTAEASLAETRAALQRSSEDLGHSKADIVALADCAETLETERDASRIESQYGYMRQKCDTLQRGRNELLKRTRVAEKAAEQTVLKAGFADNAHRVEIQKREEEIQALKGENLKLHQKCSVLQSQDIVVENEQLKKSLKAEREKKFSTVIENFDSAAAASVVALQKKNDEQQVRIRELEAQSTQQVQTLPVPPQSESKLAKNIKRIAIGAGFALAGVATVAALGFLGAVAVTYALPLLVIGLVIAAAGTAISKLTQSKYEDRMALEAITPKEVKPGFIERTVLTVKSTLEKKDVREFASEPGFI